MKYLLRATVVIILLAVPFLGRRVWFYPGRYAPPAISEIDGNQIKPSEVAYQPFVDQPTLGDGHVIIDLAHNNNLIVDDLAPLRERLAVRGVTVETLDGSGPSLETQLRGATALVILAPVSTYTAAERETIETFVADGGRLLLAADPTRPALAPAELNSLAVFSAPSAVPAINSLANAFGLIYFEDYLYNLTENEGNYRNIKFTAFNDEQPLTKDLETVVFFAVHSLQGDGVPLVWGDENTNSSLRTGETNLVTVMLAADGRVLALGDLTALTPPFHTVADNDRFLSQIADWLAIDTRQRDLEDFPYLFTASVDLVQVTDGVLDPRLIVYSETLQREFEKADRSLTLRAAPEPGHETLFVGTFNYTEPLQDYLTQAGITITLVISDEIESNEGTAVEEQPPETEEETSETNESESIVEPTLTFTPTVEVETSEPAETSTPAEESTQAEGASTDEQPEAAQTEAEGEVAKSTAETEEEKPQSTVEIEGLGTIGLEGTTLFMVDRRDDGLTLLVLAEDGDMAITALKRLVEGDFSGCVPGGQVILCSTGAAQDGTGFDQHPNAKSDTEADQKTARVFLLSADTGDGKRTSAPELAAILGEKYEVTGWSTSTQGTPSAEEIEGYDLYIIDSGDYAFNPDSFDKFFPILRAQHDLILMGAQPFLAGDAEFAPLVDLTVAEVDHPLLKEFQPGQVISLSASESGHPAMAFPNGDDMPSENVVLFSRGPNSEKSGAPAALVTTDPETGFRLLFVPFAFYRLPAEAQRTFTTNAAEWFLE